MRRVMFLKRLLAGILCLLFTCNNVFALNAVTDLIDHTSGINPTTNGNITSITTTHSIDTYHWSSFNLAGHETANFIFGANGQTALNYLSPGANPSAIYGAIMGSGARGNILLFNPNGIMMGGGASVSGANTFLASTNKFDGIVNGKVTFSEAAINNPLTLGNIQFNNVNNAHFIAPNVAVNADNLTTSNTISFRAIGGGEYDVDTNLLSNEIGVKNPIANINILDVNANIKSNKITVEAKADSETYAEAMVAGEIKANKAVTGENGEIYIIASNANTSPKAGMQVTQNALISGDSATVNLNADRICLNGNIDASGVNGGTININTKSLDQNGNISAKGTTGDGGNVNIKTTDYVAIKDSTIDVSTSNGKGGTIDVEGDYQILSSGTYKADSATDDGGKIKISAPLTKLYGTDISASGGNNGGDIYIGGSSKSTEPLQKSYLTMFNDSSSVKADGGVGHGGNIHFDSENTTYVFGNVSANNGGYVEVSAKETLGSLSDNIETDGGTIFIDPKNIIISDSGISGIVYDNLLTNGSSLYPSGTLSLTANQYFGGSTAIYNNLFAVGAPGLLGNTTSSAKGAVYLFSFNGTWANIALNQKISQGSTIIGHTFNLEDGANFGSAVALNNNLLAIGSSGDSNDKARAGAVYLLSFNSIPGNPYGSLTFNRKLDGTTTTPPIGLTSGQRFGSSVALCPSSLAGTNLLAVGAYGDNTGGKSGAGAAYLFSFGSSTPYNALTLRSKLNAATTTPVNLTGLQANDRFGSAIGLTSTLLTIGAIGDSTGGKTNAGAAYLMSFNTSSASTPYDNLTIRYKLDSSTTTPVNLTGLVANDNFGSSMALKDGMLLIGAKGDDTGGTNRGAEYIYNFTSGSNTYAGLNLSTKLASGSVILDSSGNPYTLTLLNNSAFGSASAIYNDLFSVGASGYTPAGTNYGAAYLFNFIGNQIAAYTFNAYPSATLYLSPATLASWLASSSVTLQANNDIIFRNLVAVIGGAGNDLTLQAGRSINVETGISVDLGSANLVATANEILAAGVIDAYRDAGAAEINMATGSSITTLGNVTLTNETGAGKTYSTSGDIILNNVTGNNIVINNKGTTVGSDININGTLTSTGLATLTAMDISLANTSTAYGGFNILAIGNVTTDNLITTDGTLIHPGSDVIIEAYSPTTPVPDTLITTKNITAGIGNINISLSQYLSPDVESITINGDMSGNYIKLLNSGSTGHSNIVVNGTITATASGTDPQKGIVELNAQDDVTINSPAFADVGFDIYGAYMKTKNLTTNNYVNMTGYDIDVAGAIDAKGNAILAANDIKIEADSTANTGFQLLANHSVKTENLTTVNSDVEIQGNIGTVSVPPSTIDVGNISAGNGDVTITMNDNLPVPGAITLKDITAKNIDVENKGASTSSGVLINGTLTASGNAVLKATGDVTQSTSSGGIIIAGTTDLKSGSANNITLEKITNDFVGAVTIEGANDASISDKNDLLMDTSNVTNNLTLTAGNTSGGNITQVGGSVITVGNNTNLYTPANVTLNEASNDFNSTSATGQMYIRGLTAGSPATNATIRDTNALRMGDTNVSNNLALTAGGDITQCASTIIRTGNNTYLNTPADIILEENNEFGYIGPLAQVYIGSIGSPVVNATISTPGNIAMGDSYVSNNLTLRATGNITQCAGTVINVGRNTNLITPADIILSEAGNNFNSNIGLPGQMNIRGLTIGSTAINATIMDTNAFRMGDVGLSNNMTLTAGGNITQGAGTTIAVGGGSSLTASANNITLANATNDFVGTVSIVSANDASVSDKNNILMGTSNVTNDLTLSAGNTSGGNITQVGGSSITVGNNTNLYTPASVTLGQAGNNFNAAAPNGQMYIRGLTVGSSALNATIRDINALQMGDVSLSNNLGLRAGGNITQCAPTSLAIVGTTNLTAGANNITLNNTTNDFTGAVSIVSANDANVSDKNDLLMDTSNVTNDLTLTAGNTSGGNITQVAGSAITVGNNTNLYTPANVTLNEASNDFNSTSATGQMYIRGLTAGSPATNATIRDTNAIRMGDTNVSNDLALTAGGDITQCAPTSLIIGGTTTLAAGANNITLNNTTNDFVGNVVITSANDVDIADTNDLNFGTSILTGGLTAAAGRDINANGIITGPSGIGLDADRSIGINSDINSSGGNVILIANNGSHSGSPANITMATGTIISAPNGDVDIQILNNPDAGKITLSNITASTISAWNKSLAALTDVIINPLSTLSATSTTAANPLIVSSDGGNFTNNSGAGALSTAAGRRWLVYTGSPADTTLGGLIPANTYYSSTIYTVPPASVSPGNSVLYRDPNPNPGGGGGGGGNGGIVAGAVSGGVAAGGAAAAYGSGLFPGLLLGLASPIQFDECMLDVIDQNSQSYQLLVRNMQYVYQTCDISKLDPCKIGRTKFIPDLGINNGSYQLIKVQIPPEFANAPKGVTVRITQKSYPFGISKNIPDMNFNVFNTLSEKQIGSMYQTRRFLKSNYLSKRITPLQANSNIEAANGIIQKTVFVSPNEIGNNLSIAVNYLKNGQFPRKNSTLKFDTQSYSLVVQFIENKALLN